jgi:hypothetical protein
MNTVNRAIAATELVLVSPAALFMAALLVRTLQPIEDEPAHTAGRIVMWYAERQWTLWILLIALPLAVLVTGCATLMQSDAIRANPTTLFVAAVTLSAGGFLVIVVLHMLAN